MGICSLDVEITWILLDDILSDNRHVKRHIIGTNSEDINVFFVSKLYTKLKLFKLNQAANGQRVLKIQLVLCTNPSEVTMHHCSVNCFSPLVFHTCREMSAQTQQPAAEPGHDWYLWLFHSVPSPEGVAALRASSAAVVSHACCYNSSPLIVLAHLECFEERQIDCTFKCESSRADIRRHAACTNIHVLHVT